jgi:hypothetical protein
MSDDTIDALRHVMANLPPTIHLTKRAVEWLTKSPTIYGDFTYREPVGYYACGVISPAQEWGLLSHKERTERLFMAPPKAQARCGVEDVRAAYLGNTYKVIQVARRATDVYGYRRYSKEPLTMPTCDHCWMLLDVALQTGCRKTGVYPDVDNVGHFTWRKVMLDVYTAPTVVGRAPGDSPKDEADEP